MKTRRWLLLLLIMIVATMSMATFTGVTRSLFNDGETSTNDVLGIRWGLTTLTDGFEGAPWDNNWNDNGATAWVQDGGNVHGGSWSALSDTGNIGSVTSDDFDASGTTAITVSFWFRGNTLAAGDFLVEIYNGASYATLVDVATLPSYVADDTWYQFAQVIGDSQYFLPGFHLRFRTSALTGPQTASVDDVTITTIVDALAPAVPTGLGATPSDGQVSLSWTANTEPDLYGYNVYRGTTPGGPYSQINGLLLATNSYPDTGLTNGTIYYYVVTAVDTSANESGNSGEVGAMAADAVAPANPTGLGATPGDAQVSLNWTAPADLDIAGYNVYRSLISGSGYAKINGSLVVPTTYTDLTAANGTTYYYVVTTVDTSTNASGNSNETSATPVAVPLTLLSDGFGGSPWDIFWGSGTTTWVVDTTLFSGGIPSALSDRNNNGLLTSYALDASLANNITVSFMFNADSIDAGDVLIEIYNGSTWATLYDLSAYPGYVSTTWVSFSVVITDSQYFTSTFKIQFNSSVGGKETINIDDVFVGTNQ